MLTLVKPETPPKPQVEFRCRMPRCKNPPVAVRLLWKRGRGRQSHSEPVDYVCQQHLPKPGGEWQLLLFS
jgi:hypothetical protein